MDKKIAFVTGGTTGIGREIGLTLAEKRFFCCYKLQKRSKGI